MDSFQYWIECSREHGGIPQSDLNKLGSQGWELFQVETTKLSEGPLYRVYYFKRKFNDAKSK
jgi:hypothetical protein